MCWTCSLMVDQLTGIKYWENTPELRLIWLMVWLLMASDDPQCVEEHVKLW